MNPKLSIVKGTNDKPASSAELSEIFASTNDLTGQVLLGYPLLASPDGRQAIDALWVSPQKGILIFDLVEGQDVG